MLFHELWGMFKTVYLITNKPKAAVVDLKFREQGANMSI